MSDHPATDGTTDKAIRAALDACQGHGLGTHVTFAFEPLYDLVGGLMRERDELQKELRTTLGKAHAVCDELSAALSAQQSAERELAKAMRVVEAAEQHKADLRLHVDLAVKKCEMAEADRERLRECQVETQGKLELTERTNVSLMQQCRDADERFLALLEERNKAMRVVEAARKALDGTFGDRVLSAAIRALDAATEGGKTSTDDTHAGSCASQPLSPPLPQGGKELGQLCMKCGGPKEAWTHDPLSLSPLWHPFEPAPAQTEGGESAEDERDPEEDRQALALYRGEVPKLCDEIAALRVQLAESEKRNAEFLRCAHACDEVDEEMKRLRAELATIAEKTAREQREACANGVRDGISRAEVLAVPLVADAPSNGVPYERPEVLWFAEEMEKKLRDNDHKGHWSRCDFPYLDRRLDEEVDELKTARSRLKRGAGETVARVISEAADVANFAMMIADNARRLLTPPLVTDAPSKPEDESMRRNVIPCTCGGGRDTMCPEHGVMNGQDCPACGSWVYQWDSRERCPNPDCRRQFSPKDWGEEIPTCKHGAPNCTAEHE